MANREPSQPHLAPWPSRWSRLGSPPRCASRRGSRIIGQDTAIVLLNGQGMYRSRPRWRQNRRQQAPASTARMRAALRMISSLLCQVYSVLPSAESLVPALVPAENSTADGLPTAAGPTRVKLALIYPPACDPRRPIRPFRRWLDFCVPRASRFCHRCQSGWVLALLRREPLTRLAGHVERRIASLRRRRALDHQTQLELLALLRVRDDARAVPGAISVALESAHRRALL